MQRRWYSSWIGRAALVSAALIFAAGTSLAKAPHGGGGGGGGHGGGGGGHSGGGGGGRSFSSGGGRSFSSGSASFSGRSTAPSVSRSSAFAPSTASTFRGTTGSSTWNHNGNWNHAGTWNHNGNHHGDHHHRDRDFFFFGFPFWSDWFWGYPYPYFSGGFPSWYYWNDYAYNTGPAYAYTQDGNVYSTEQAPQPPADLPKLDDNAVLIGVRVPDNAVIWFDGDKTNQTGMFREFISPVLEPGQKYTYDIKAQWTENGKDVVRTRKIDVYAGDRLMVNFLAPAKSAPPRPQPLKAPNPAPPTPIP